VPARVFHAPLCFTAGGVQILGRVDVHQFGSIDAKPQRETGPVEQMACTDIAGEFGQTLQTVGAETGGRAKPAIGIKAGRNAVHSSPLDQQAQGGDFDKGHVGQHDQQPPGLAGARLFHRKAQG